MLHVARRAEHVKTGMLNEQIGELSNKSFICMKQGTKAAVKNRQVIHNALLVHNDTAAMDGECLSPCRDECVPEIQDSCHRKDAKIKSFFACIVCV